MREYLLVMLVAAAITYLLCSVWRRVAVRIGALAQVRARDVHTKPTPYLGGMAMLCGAAGAFFLASALPFLSKHPVVTHDARGILAAGAVICLVGAIDDAIDLPVLAKIFGQVLAASVAVLFGVRLYWISTPNAIYALDTATSTLITVLLIFVCVNAINLIDGLDGLSSGVVGIGASAMFLYTYLLAHGENLVVATTASLVTVTITGICLGFLPHNFHPAKMFMGDSGSMLLGLMLACSTISFTGQMDSSLLESTLGQGGFLMTWMPLLLPVAVIALPLVDMTLAYFRRTWHGEWWFKPDKHHLHHRLLERGHSERKAALIMYLWAAVIAYGMMLIGLVRARWVWIALLIAVAVCVLATLWPTLRRRMARVKPKVLLSTRQQ